MPRPPKSHWNYRVIETVDPDGEVSHAIHEVHYRAGKPSLVALGRATACWAPGIDDPRAILANMAKALDKPAIPMVYFDDLGKEAT